MRSREHMITSGRFILASRHAAPDSSAQLEPLAPHEAAHVIQQAWTRDPALRGRLLALWRKHNGIVVSSDATHEEQRRALMWALASLSRPGRGELVLLRRRPRATSNDLELPELPAPPEQSAVPEEEQPWLEFEVLDQDDLPVTGLRYVLDDEDPDAPTALGDKAYAYKTGVEDGDHSVTFVPRELSENAIEPRDPLIFEVQITGPDGTIMSDLRCQLVPDYGEPFEAVTDAEGFIRVEALRARSVTLAVIGPVIPEA